MPRKLFKDISKEKTAQLKLFELLDVEKFTHAVVVDLIPKYYWGKLDRVEGKYLPVLERAFKLDGVNFSMRIFPGSIKVDENTPEEYFYLGLVEENVETALRKLLTNGKGAILNNEVGVVFSLYELRTELAKTGHKYSYPQIRKALKILNRVNIEIQSEDKSLDYSFNIISELGFAGEESETQTFVIFSNFLSQAIETNNYRMFNYDRFMELENVVARYLFKRMSIFYRQASLKYGLEYTIGLDQIVQGAGLKEQKYTSLYLRTVYPGLVELGEKGIIMNFTDSVGKSYHDFINGDFEDDVEMKDKKKDKDKNIKFTITPSMEFVQDVKFANQKNAEKIELVLSKNKAKLLSGENEGHPEKRD